ncbi:hypothetical protein [Roseibium sediminis]|uniref:hypothetical protein n=1 Tax=Roseibium sediminis TaxID=1775174 RepID=UPI00123D2E2B|nr:hypothetical protein [Roseibium sediminis]
MGRSANSRIALLGAPCYALDEQIGAIADPNAALIALGATGNILEGLANATSHVVCRFGCCVRKVLN